MTAPAGWYADTNAPGTERYWDGGQWTVQTRVIGAPSAPPAPPAGTQLVAQQVPVAQQAPVALPTAKEVKTRARAEKAYRKASRPLYKKKRFLLPVALIAIIAVVVSANSSSTKKQQAVAKKTCVGKSYPDQQLKNDTCADAAGRLSLGAFTVTASPLKIRSDGTGGTAVCTNISMKNTSSRSQDYNVLDFKVQTPSGDVASTSVLSFAGTLDSGTLIGGATKTGLLCNDGKAEKGTYVLIYKPNAFEDARGIWLFKV